MKVLICKKSTIRLILVFMVLACVCAVNMGGSTVASIYLNNSHRLVPIYNVQTDEKKVAISFDAAWGADKTLDILSVCESYGVKATFFLVGFWMEDYPEQTRQIAEAGFEIGIHSNTHPDMTKLSATQMKMELTENLNILKNTTGLEATLFRPPFGAYNNTLINVCDEMGLKAIQWDVDSLDWKGLSASDLAGRVIKRAKNGSIVLFHNNSDNIIEGLKMVLEYLTTNGYQVVPVGDLIYQDNYKINNQGTQIKNI